MQIDILWLRKNFEAYNQKYFDGVLPTPTFHIGRSKTRLGYLAYKRGLTMTGRIKWVKENAFTLGMSNYYDMSEYDFRNVLLHEMIHLSIAASGIKDTSPHGVVFRGMMARLNRDGWKIQVMTNMHGQHKAYTGSSNVIQQYLVLAIEMKDGKHFLSSVNPRFARQINTRLQRVREIKSYKWYTTNSRWFEDMPKVRSLRGRVVSKEVFEEKTNQMKAITS